MEAGSGMDGAADGKNEDESETEDKKSNCLSWPQLEIFGFDGDRDRPDNFKTGTAAAKTGVGNYRLERTTTKTQGRTCTLSQENLPPRERCAGRSNNDHRLQPRELETGDRTVD